MVYSHADYHNVDEDLKTLVARGGEYGRGEWGDTGSGVFLCSLMDQLNDDLDNVAFCTKINRTYTPFGDAYYC